MKKFKLTNISMKKFTMKRLPALLIMLAVVSGAQADNIRVTIGNLWYMLNTADNTATVSATTESISGAFTIPEKVSYNGVSYAVTSVGKDCFISCKNLESVVIPNSVKSLGYASFQGCTSLVSVTIGSNVTEIGWNSFEQCKALKSITSLAVTPLTCLPNDYKNVDCFSGVDKTNCLLTVPDGSLNAYKSADPWKKFYKIEETTAIEAVSAAKAKVYAAGERIVVEGVSADAKVNIIDTAGRTVYAGKGDTSVNAPAHGIYIVRVDGASVKVAL